MKSLEELNAMTKEELVAFAQETEQKMETYKGAYDYAFNEAACLKEGIAALESVFNLIKKK